jgi:hypothetical protein
VGAEAVGASMVLVVLVLVLAVVWVLMPLAVIGIKPLLRQILQELRKIHEVLQQQQRK